MIVTFSFLKDTKNFNVYRELDSKGVQFPDSWDELRAHPEQHKIGSIYIRKGLFENDLHTITIEVKDAG